MSLYNALFGENELADVLLAALGLERDDVPRYRDCYIDGDHIVVHTRTGGGNREEYAEANAALAHHPGHLFDVDDDFDGTYADFHFRFPPEYEADLKAIVAKDDQIKPSEKWQALFASMRKDVP